MKQLDKSKGPGVYIPPPLFYAFTFVAAVLVQKKIPLPNELFHLLAVKVLGIVLLLLSLSFLVTSLRQFFQTKNTIILIKPATSLETTKIYKLTRNPMYLGLMIAYIGIACLIGNWWNFIFLPLLFLIIQEYVIKREEKYLELEFGQEYRNYKNKVRRWL